MKYEVLVALLGVSKALKVDESATFPPFKPSGFDVADVSCPAGFSDGDSPRSCMPTNMKPCPKNMFFSKGACIVLCKQGFKPGAKAGECVRAKPTIGGCKADSKSSNWTPIDSNYQCMTKEGKWRCQDGYKWGYQANCIPATAADTFAIGPTYVCPYPYSLGMPLASNTCVNDQGQYAQCSLGYERKGTKCANTLWYPDKQALVCYPPYSLGKNTNHECQNKDGEFAQCQNGYIRKDNQCLLPETTGTAATGTIAAPSKCPCGQKLWNNQCVYDYAPNAANACPISKCSPGSTEDSANRCESSSGTFAGCQYGYEAHGNYKTLHFCVPFPQHGFKLYTAAMDAICGGYPWRTGKTYANHDCVQYVDKKARKCQIGYEMQSSKCVRKGAHTVAIASATTGTIGMGPMKM